jgi:hypothetical protein
MANDKSTFKYYNYDPSLAAAAVFAILFLLTSLMHIVQLIKLRTWYFIPVAIGGIMECIGYAARIQSSEQSPNWTLGPYIIQALLILVAPAMISASIYMILGRIIIAIDGEKFSLIRKKWLTKIFVATDILSFLVLSGGMCYSSPYPVFLRFYESSRGRTPNALMANISCVQDLAC